MIDVKCKCGKSYQVPEDWVGREVNCKKCGSRFTVEQPEPEPEPDLEPDQEDTEIVSSPEPGHVWLSLLGLSIALPGLLGFFFALVLFAGSDFSVTAACFLFFSIPYLSLGGFLSALAHARRKALACSRCHGIVRANAATVCPSCGVKLTRRGVLP